MDILIYFFIIVIIMIGLITYFKISKKKRKNLDNTDGPPDDIYPLY